MSEQNFITDFELAEDTKTLLQLNIDAKCINPELQEEILSLDDSILLKVKKTINSPIIIHSVEKVTEDIFKDL